MVRAIFVIALCVLSSLPAQATSRGNFREGYQALLRRDYDKAIAHLTRAIEIGDLSRGNQALAYHYRGALYLKRERNEDAIQDLDRALALNPRLATAYSDRGIAHRRKGQYELAIADYTEAIRAYGPNGTIGTCTGALRSAPSAATTRRLPITGVRWAYDPISSVRWLRAAMPIWPRAIAQMRSPTSGAP